MTASGPRRGRPRQRETGERILQATREILRDQGPTAVSIDAVATRSGVARTTIYRRYRHRRELVAAALEHLLQRPFPPPELPVADKLRWVLDDLSDLLEEGVGRGGTAAVLSGTDPEFTALLRRRIEGRLTVLKEVMRSDVDTGRMAPHVDADTVVGLLLGAYLGEVVRHGQLRDGWAASTVRLLTHAVSAH